MPRQNALLACTLLPSWVMRMHSLISHTLICVFFLIIYTFDFERVYSGTTNYIIYISTTNINAYVIESNILCWMCRAFLFPFNSLVKNQCFLKVQNGICIAPYSIFIALFLIVGDKKLDKFYCSTRLCFASQLYVIPLRLINVVVVFLNDAWSITNTTLSYIQLFIYCGTHKFCRQNNILGQEIFFFLTTINELSLVLEDYDVQSSIQLLIGILNKQNMPLSLLYSHILDLNQYLYYSKLSSFHHSWQF